MSKLTLTDVLQMVYAEKLPVVGEFVEVPTALFVEKVDVGMNPLPPIAFYEMGPAGPVQFKAKDQSFSPLALSLKDKIWIHLKDYALIRKYAENAILGAGNQLPIEQRMEILRNSAMTVVDDLFTNPSPQNIQRSNKMVGSFVYVLMKDPKAYLFLAKLSSHDPYTLQHSVGAAVNAIILARKIGISSEKELNEVGMGGLFHDLGKVKVRPEIINKAGPLDEQEWEEMRKHPEAGYDLLKANPDVPDRSKRAVLEHHEDKTGGGYPFKRVYREIDLHSKIVGIADIFNALTTKRSYAEARTPYEAFELMGEKMRHKIDEDLFAALVLVYGGKLNPI